MQQFALVIGEKLWACG